MPPLVRVIAMVLIGLPGGILWIVGMLAFLLACWKVWETPVSYRFEIFIFLGGSVLSSAIGFAMVAAAEMLSGAKRYRMPTRKLPAYLGLELLEGFLAVAFVGIILAAIASFAKNEGAAGASWTAMGIIALFLLAANHRTVVSNGQKWRAEPTDQTPPTDC